MTYVEAQSEDTTDARDKWRWIKRIRSDYKPRAVTLTGPDGKPTVSCSKQADTFAKHIVTRGLPGSTKHRPHLPTHARQPGEHGAMQPSRCAHRHGIPKEALLLQWLTVAGLLCLNCSTPLSPCSTGWSEAVVAQVHKRGTMADPNNYRPMSLLCITQKLFASII